MCRATNRRQNPHQLGSERNEAPEPHIGTRAERRDAGPDRRLSDTQVVVDGRGVDEDGKTAAGNRVISLDSFTVAALRHHVRMLDEERHAFGSAYEDNSRLLV